MSAPNAPPPMGTPIPRVIESLDQDDDGAWFARLDCAHRRHIVHRPPMSVYPWIASVEGRASRLGTRIECGRCSQRVWPDGLEHYRSTPTFTHESVPHGLLREHATKAGVWGKLRVIEGELRLDFSASLGTSDELVPGIEGVIPPEVPHHVELRGPVRFVVDFYRVALTGSEA